MLPSRGKDRRKFRRLFLRLTSRPFRVLCCCCVPTICIILCFVLDYTFFWRKDIPLKEIRSTKSVRYAVESQVDVWREFTFDYFLPTLSVPTIFQRAFGIGSSTPCNMKMIKPTVFLSPKNRVAVIWDMASCTPDVRKTVDFCMFETPGRTPCVVTKGFDFFGNDLYEKRDVKTHEECCSICRNDKKCFAWGWNDGTIDPQYKNMCFLKGSVNQKKIFANAAVVSGIRCDPQFDVDEAAEAFRKKSCPPLHGTEDAPKYNKSPMFCCSLEPKTSRDKEVQGIDSDSCCLHAHEIGGKGSHWFMFQATMAFSSLQTGSMSSSSVEDGGSKMYKFEVSSGGTGKAEGGKSGQKPQAFPEKVVHGAYPLAIPSSGTSRGGESFKVAIIGDSQSGAVSFDRLLREIDDVKPNLAIHLGDVVQDADVVREWHSYFFRPLEFRGLSNRIPWIVARGNHDIINKQRVFPNRGNGTSGPAPIFVNDRAFSNGGMHFFSITVSSIRFVVLDTNVNSREQREFLESEFQSSEFLTAAFRVVLCHIPPFLEYWNPGAWFEGGESAWGAFVKWEWNPMFRRAKVDVVISGHSHIYQRGKSDGVQYIISGGGGALLEELQNNRVDDYGFYTVTKQVNHFLEMTFQSSRCQLEFRAINLNGKAVDTFQVEGANGCK